MNTFENLGLNSQLLAAIARLGFTEPTEIQEKSIPHIINGKDVIGESATGSGKTLAFGCGIMEQVIHKEGLQALVLTPTRELAEQVKDALSALANQKSLNIIAVYGGVSINTQIKNLPWADVVVATPGRLLDHLRRRTVNISGIKLLVLDEADRMLDMGFINDVEQIIRACPAKRQTLFFSATILPSIKSLANRHMKTPVEVLANNMVDPAKLKQVYFNISRDMKISLLVHLLQSETSGLAMVFCNTRRSTDFVVRSLRRSGTEAIAIHGGLSQNQRTRTIGLFNDAGVNILVCTDVASRGLDIANVSHIYNYEIPKVPNDYIHRIGRTARAGEEGKVINLLSECDRDYFHRIRSEYRTFSIESMDTPEVKEIPAGKPGNYRPRAREQFHHRQNSHGQRHNNHSFRR
ncbi:MAG: DEAD/DEAH box helicase [Thermoplasmata archaeon]